MKHIPLCFSLLFVCTSAFSEETENASNPLAKVKNTDVRVQHFEDKNNNKWNDWSVEGAFMATNDLKIKYELHYWDTDIAGNKENNLESALIKAIYFAKEGEWENSNYRVALGLDVIKDLGDDDKGIGSGSDQFGPFVALAMGFEGGRSLIPLVQQYVNLNGDDVNTTAFRLIMMQPLENKAWMKFDAKLPVDWEHDNAIPATFEVQYGQSFNNGVGVFVDALAGLGSDRPYDWGLGLGVRFNY